MQIAEEGVDFVSAPKDYATLFEVYYPYVVSLVRRLGIAADRQEDVACEILLRFCERDLLNKFDPSMVFEYMGEAKPARFKSFLSKIVARYVKGQLDKQHRMAARELLLCDMPVEATADKGWGHPHAATWIECYGGTVNDEDDVISLVDAEVNLRYMRDYLRTVPRKSCFDRCDLVALYDVVIRQAREYDMVDYDEIQEIFDISSTAAYNWVHWLRINLALALGRPEPKKRARTVKK